MSKSILITILSFVFFLPVFAADTDPRVPITLAKDGFPVGNDTPEGMACDLARSFIHHDSALFISTCVRPTGSSEKGKAYRAFLDDMVSQMKQVTDKTATPSPHAPKAIDKCFAARHLKNKQPASFARNTFGIQDIAFVDVEVTCLNDTPHLCRTLLYKEQDGRWIVNPRPDLAPLLSTGLEDESPSTVDFTKVYRAKNGSPPQ